MAPKEKAEELVVKFLKLYNKVDGYVIIQDHTIITPKNQYHISYFSNCALATVDEIMDALEKNGSWNYDYWKEVKQEIEKL